MFNKVWLTGENVSKQKLNDYLETALTELFTKRLDVCANVASNRLYLNHDANTFMKFDRPIRVTVNVPEGAAVRICLYAMMDTFYQSGTADVRQFSYYDVKIDDEIYLSSGNGTPTTDGVMKQTHDNQVARPVRFAYIMTELEAGQHTFELVGKATGSTATYTIGILDNSFFSAEVYGINSGHLIAANAT